MALTLRTWRWPQLVLGWTVYWILLALVMLGPAVSALWGLSRAGAHGTASFLLGDGAAALSISAPGAVWAGKISLAALTAWIVVPPFLLWALWTITRPNDLIRRESR